MPSAPRQRPPDPPDHRPPPADAAGPPGTDDRGEHDAAGRLLALGAFIRDQRRQSRLSMRKLADLAGVSNPYLSQIERGLRKPSAEILQQLAGALEVSTQALYVRAGILDDRGDAVDVVGEVLRDPHLTPEHRRALVRVYRAFRAEAGAPLPPVPPGGDPDFPESESSRGPER